MATDQHQITVLSSGEGMMEELKPTCSCGWVGKGYEAYNSWQWTNVQEQVVGHLASVKWPGRLQDVGRHEPVND